MRKVLVCLLVALVLFAAVPVATVSAADGGLRKPIAATLVVQSIGTGDVRPVGDYPDGNYYWTVRDRPIAGAISGTFAGTWQYVYSGVLQPDQSGRVHGDISITTATGTAFGNATAELGDPQFVGVTFMNADFATAYPVITATLSNSRFAITRGSGDLSRARGNGTLDGLIYAVLDPAGEHVVAVACGQFPLFLPTQPPTYDGNPVSTISMTGWLVGR
jgi:hypothetical protein